MTRQINLLNSLLDVANSSSEASESQFATDEVLQTTSFDPMKVEEGSISAGERFCLSFRFSMSHFKNIQRQNIEMQNRW